MDKINLTNHQITNIAEANDLGLDVFINVKTNEIIELPNLLNGPIMEFNEYHSENLEKVEYNWHNIEKIECPNSNESYRIMASFVDELSESSLKSKLSNALNRPKPFGNFSRIIHSCILREKWFEYKYKMLERRAVEIINEINIINNWK